MENKFMVGLYRTMVIIFIGVLLVLFFVPCAHADTLVLTSQECIHFGNSAGNVAEARKNGKSLEDIYKFYDDNLGTSKDKLTPRNRLIYKLVNDQIKEIYSLSQEEFDTYTPEEIAQSFFTECLAAQGKFKVFPDEVII